MAQNVQPLNIRTMADDLQKIQAGKTVAPPSTLQPTQKPQPSSPPQVQKPEALAPEHFKPMPAPTLNLEAPPAPPHPFPTIPPQAPYTATKADSLKNTLDELLPLEIDSGDAPPMSTKAQKDQPAASSESEDVLGAPAPPAPQQPETDIPPAPTPALTLETPPAPPKPSPPFQKLNDYKNLEREIFPSPYEEGDQIQAPEELLGFQKQKEEVSAPLMYDIAPQISPKAPVPEPPQQAPLPPPAPKPVPTPPFPAPPMKSQEPPLGREVTGFPIQPPKKPFLSKTVMLIGALVILGAALVGGALYLIFSPNEEIAPPPAIEEEPLGEEERVDTTPPASVITPDFMLDLSVSSITEAEIRRALNTIADFAFPEGSITYVTLRIEGVVVNNQAQFVKTEEFLSALGVQAPEGLFGVVENDLMLYVYGSGNEERILCQDNLVTERECYGPRLALAFRAQAGQEGQLDALRAEWQEMAPDTNLNQLVLSDLVSSPQDNYFESTIYTSERVEDAPEITVYFKNLLMPDYDNLGLSAAALDFAVVDNILIFATSKNSLEAIIDLAL